MRPHTRRRTAVKYPIERMLPEESAQLRAAPRSEEANVLVFAGAAASALRQQLRAVGIDPKLARLVLLFDHRTALRVSDVAWRLNVSKATASRLLDRAERTRGWSTSCISL